MAARRLKFDRTAFALGVGFCAVPIMLVGYFNKSVRDTLRPYVVRVRDEVSGLSGRGYETIYHVISHERPPPPQALLASVRLQGVQRAELANQEPAVAPELPAEVPAPVVPQAAATAASAARGPYRSLHVRGSVSLTNLESAARAMHGGEKPRE